MGRRTSGVPSSRAPHFRVVLCAYPFDDDSHSDYSRFHLHMQTGIETMNRYVDISVMVQENGTDPLRNVVLTILLGFLLLTCQQLTSHRVHPYHA